MAAHLHIEDIYDRDLSSKKGSTLDAFRDYLRKAVFCFASYVVRDSSKVELRKNSYTKSLDRKLN